MKNSFCVSGNIIDVVAKRIFSGEMKIQGGRIISIKEKNNVQSDHYILPGFIDSHIHIESSMLIPSEFARIAVTHGTVSTVSDPHEIANVLGNEGIKFMIDNGEKTSFNFHFGAPSCVPATPFETSGYTIGIKETEELLKMDEIKYLAEMMNFPGVIQNNLEVIKKIGLAKKYDKPVDGHAPKIIGKDLDKYINSGISTDHECVSYKEAEEKIKKGMKILIREGSAAKNFEELIGLIKYYPDNIMLCSDDMHPDNLINGHINTLVKRAIKKGYNPIDVIRSCTLNPSEHYNLNSCLLQEGDVADFILIDNLDEVNILETYLNGKMVASKGKSFIKTQKEKPINNFCCNPITDNSIKAYEKPSKTVVIDVFDQQLFTKKYKHKASIFNGENICDLDNDILKIVVVNRYEDSKPSVAFIRGFGLKKGAIASSIAHDSHNIISVGTNDADITAAINCVIKEKGAIVLCNKSEQEIIPLPFGGLMTDSDGYSIARKYTILDNLVKSFGSELKAPFMTLSFMALLVIPEIKLSDKGLFDSECFKFINTNTS